MVYSLYYSWFILAIRYSYFLAVNIFSQVYLQCFTQCIHPFLEYSIPHDLITTLPKKNLLSERFSNAFCNL